MSLESSYDHVTICELAPGPASTVNLADSAAGGLVQMTGKPMMRRKSVDTVGIRCPVVIFSRQGDTFGFALRAMGQSPAMASQFTHLVAMLAPRRSHRATGIF